MFANSFTPSQVYREFLINLNNNYDDALNLQLKNLTDRNVQDAGILILYMANIVRNILEGEMFLKCSQISKKELMSSWHVVRRNT